MVLKDRGEVKADKGNRQKTKKESGPKKKEYLIDGYVIRTRR